MTDRELLQQALDLLEDINQCSLPPTGIFLPAEIDHVMEALRARLAQREQEPVAWGVDEGEGRCISLHDLYFVKEDADHMAELKGTHAKVVALYTAPPKKEWVGLTGYEVNECAAGCQNGNSVQDAIRKAEAKLKEKNI
jgi:hypothetical protein